MNRHSVKSLLSSMRGIEGWLLPIDAYLIGLVDDIQSSEGIQGGIFEIGVHHGKSLILLRSSRKSEAEQVGACDVFEDQSHNSNRSGMGDREIVEANLRRHFGTAPGIEIFSMPSADLSVVQTTSTCRLFHIDGGHTGEIVFEDLKRSSQGILDQGIVILDDLFNPGWPGVSEGFYRFQALHAGELAPLIIGGNKAFFCRPGFHARYLGHLADIHRIQTTHFPGVPYIPEMKRFMGFDTLVMRPIFTAGMNPMIAGLVQCFGLPSWLSVDRIRKLRMLKSRVYKKARR